MKGIFNLLALSVMVGLCSPVLAEETAAVDTVNIRGNRLDVKREETHAGTDRSFPPVTFYCCDKTGKVSCTVNAPGPVGEPCFCPGVVPAGVLCMPRQ